MNGPRVSTRGPTEGSQRKWGRPERVISSPRCVVKVAWPKAVDGVVRLDLEAVAAAEYFCGANAERPDRVAGDAEFTKGWSKQPAKLFCSEPEIGRGDRGFAEAWLRCEPRLGGQDRLAWTLQQAWCVHVLRRPILATHYNRSPKEQHQFRVRLCPELSAGVALAEAGRMEEYVHRFLDGVALDFAGPRIDPRTGNPARDKLGRLRPADGFAWMAACHFSTGDLSKVGRPHAHIAIRGITLAGHHLYFQKGYLNPTALEKSRKPDASSPIEWRARGILAEMMSEQGEAQHVG